MRSPSGPFAALVVVPLVLAVAAVAVAAGMMAAGAGGVGAGRWALAGLLGVGAATSTIAIWSVRRTLLTPLAHAAAGLPGPGPSLDRLVAALAGERQARALAEERAQGLADRSGEVAERLATLGRAVADVAGEAFADADASVGQVTRIGARQTALSALADQIARTATAFGAASDDLARRTETQAATLEETAAALGELTASVQAAAHGASEVDGVVGKAREEAGQSADVVNDAVAAMAGIERSSQEIGQIIGVIDDIAFQTNLLALNAGVEAARAGEAGRGFAVVASEVRTLAQRSSDAARQIKDLVGDSARQVRSGVELVGRAGVALTAITGRVAQIAELVSDIAHGAAEQASALGEISNGVTELDRVTQENAAMASEAAGAMQALRSDADRLVELAAGPGLPRPTAPPRPEAPPAPPARPSPVAALRREATTGQAVPDPMWEEF